MSRILDERVANLQFDDLTAEGNPTEEGQVRLTGGDLVGFIGGAVKSLTLGGGGGITEPQHQDLDTLVHRLSENAYSVATYGGPFGRLSNVTDYTDITQTTKVREHQLTYTGPLVTQTTTIQYDAGGLEVERLTKTYVYIPGTARVQTIIAVRTP